ncbi:hypothetical protein QUF99_08910 [Bacillus sp. DX4.1]|uniref:hypothetical protein n=1 Tax=Bacillus sp. DX4.1 TaxID=3055867 RepID=UPI00259FE985|nr:hypothetical protein [Bacillus sp. DX4.1]MDM5187434.1 hypothetical protein [Bacillus sp. DX4.1]
MNEFQRNPIATDEDYFKLSSIVYKDSVLKKGTEIEGSNGNLWVVIESINAKDPGQVKNGLQAIAVVRAKEYEEGKTDYKNIILSFRGTKPEELDGDITIDIKQIFLGVKKNYRMNDEQVENVETTFETGLKWAKNDIVAKYKPESLHTTGHSKGAGEADLIAAELNCYATTWAAPNVYRLLSDEAKKRVDEGVMENKATDYTHKNDKVGNFTQFDAPLIGKQYTVKHNGSSDGIYAYAGLAGHMLSTFEGIFHNGGVQLELEPDDIIRHAKEIQKISDLLLDIVKNIERFQQQEEEEVAKLKSQLKHETGPGGKYHLLEEHEVDEAIRKIAKASQDGKDYFHDVKLAEELIHLLRKKQKELIRFGDDIAYAANSLRDKDNQLGTNLEGLAVR